MHSVKSLQTWDLRRNESRKHFRDLRQISTQFNRTFPVGRTRTINVDLDGMLAGIARQTRTTIADLEAAVAEQRKRHQFAGPEWAELHRVQTVGVTVNLPAFVGRELSPSWRIRCQQALRQAERDGLVLIDGRKATRVLLTATGWARVQTSATAEESGVPDGQ